MEGELLLEQLQADLDRVVSLKDDGDDDDRNTDDGCGGGGGCQQQQEQQQQDDLILQQQKKNSILKTKLKSVREKRKKLKELRDRETSMRVRLEQQMNVAINQNQSRALLNYQSALSQKHATQAMLKFAYKWNVLNDCFHITYQGPYATINGLRLGSESPYFLRGNIDGSSSNSRKSKTTATTNATTGEPLSSSTTAATADDGNGGSGASSPNTTTGTTTTSSRYFLFTTGSSDQQQPTSPSSVSASEAQYHQHYHYHHHHQPVVPPRVPWSEINSALGQVALLLSILEKRPHCGIKYRHVIVYQGSTSKMGIKRARSSIMGGVGSSSSSTTTSATDATAQIDLSSLSLYNLYSDDSFQFFGRRNFNIALECLVECVMDAASAVQKHDPTITLPHIMVEKSVTANIAEITIGGIPITYKESNTTSSGDGTSAVAAANAASEWTRVMKYLLTNIKHLLTFRGFGLWGYE